jgi:tetratricopeptide (TPR) repeat protein
MTTGFRRTSRRAFMCTVTALISSGNIIPNMLSSDKMDSLRLRLDDLLVLLDAAKEDVQRGKPASALILLDTIRESDGLDLIKDRPPLFSLYLLTLAQACKQAGDTERAIGAYDQLQLIAASDGLSSLYGECIVGKLVVLTNSGRAALAGALYNKHQSELRSVPSMQFQIELAARKVRILEELGHIDEARRILGSMILPRSEDVDELGYQLDRQLLACRLCISGDDKNWKEAEAALAKAEYLVRTELNLQRRAQFSSTCGLFEYRVGNVDAAYKFAQSAKQTLDVGGVRSYHHDELVKLLSS